MITTNTSLQDMRALDSRTRSITLLLVVILLGLALMGCSSDSALGVYLEANQEHLHRARSEQAAPQTFLIEPGTPAKAIAQKLQEEGLINDALLFEAYVRSTGLARKLEAGSFLLSPHMTPVEIAEALQEALAPGITVRIPEGWRLEQAADYLSQRGGMNGAEYRRAASAADLSILDDNRRGSYDFLAFLPAGASLEGYLFPSSYEIFAENATVADLLGRQLDEFGARVMPVYWDAVASGATAMELHDVLTLASIVEREAVLDEERPAIAGVYLNRLDIGKRLEADPTVQYAMGYQPDSGQWWKTPVYLSEYKGVDSQYNTYLYEGLPPGPIAAPGLASIEAVLHPEEHDFLFFVAEPGGTGRHVFSRTYDDHLENVRRYQSQ
ncbi:MAG: endolytic transglycosylase MltG [Chloroflexota bacterium]|nr:endolytic transglycosylase MltG [Chloroflexota bacterium]